MKGRAKETRIWQTEAATHFGHNFFFVGVHHLPLAKFKRNMFRIFRFVLGSTAIFLLSSTHVLSTVISPHWASSSLGSADAIFVGKLTSADIQFTQDQLPILGAANEMRHVSRTPGTAIMAFDVVDTTRGQLPNQISVVLLEGIRDFSFSDIPRRRYLVAIRKLNPIEKAFLKGLPNYEHPQREVYKLVDRTCSGPAIVEYSENSMLRSERKLAKWHEFLYPLLSQIERVAPSVTSGENIYPFRAYGCGQF